MASKITKRTVDATQVMAKDVFVWDSEAKGFGLKVTPTGRKVYVVQYRLPGLSTRRYTIGRHGSPWTPDAARLRAIEVLGQVAAGIDPADEKRARKQDISVTELCDKYLIEGVRTKKASTVANDRSRIKRHVKPLIGQKRVKALVKPDIEKFMRDVADGKSATDEKTGLRGRAIVSGGKGIANRTLDMLASILQFAVDEGLRPDNPARGVKKFKGGRPARFLSNEEMARLGDALRAAETGGINLFAIAALRLLLLTGCRRNEILTLRWEEVDFEQGFLRLGESKTGAKTVPIGAPALSILTELPRLKDNPYVIAGSKEGYHLVGLQKVWSAVRTKARLDNVRLHDLRHSFASVGARSGESLLVIGKVLGHATASATSRYAHLSDDPVRAASENVSILVQSALGNE